MTNWRASLPTAVYIGAISLGVFLRNSFTKGDKWAILINNHHSAPIGVKVVMCLPLVYIVRPIVINSFIAAQN